MQAQTVKKIDQFDRFKALGIATPMTARLDENQDIGKMHGVNL